MQKQISAARLAMEAGDCFRRFAEAVLKDLPEDLDEAGRFANERGLGPLAACATNLTLATKLYLKAILLFERRNPPKTHNLTKLFKALPPIWKGHIDQHYQRGASAPGIEDFAIYVRAQKPLESLEGIPGCGESIDRSLEAVLARNRNAFVSWRYLYEGLPSDGTARIRFEFRRLSLIGDVLRKSLLATFCRENAGEGV